MSVLASLGEWLRVWWNRLRFRFQREALEREMAEEMRQHQELLVRDAIAEGQSADEARVTARRRFGNEVYFREGSRDSWSIRRLDEMLQDVRFALRSVRRNAMVSGAIILTLALAIGANTAVFRLLSALLFESLPVTNAARIVKLERTEPTGTATCCFPPSLIDHLRQSRALPAVVAYDLTRLNVNVGGVAEAADGALVSGSLWELLGVRAMVGRLFSLEEDRPGASPVTVISYPFWVRRFGSDRSVIGQSVDLDGIAVTIVGVLPSDFTLALGQIPPEFWLPISLQPQLGLNDHTEFHVYGLLAPGVSADVAGTELTIAYLGFMADSLQRPAGGRPGEAGARGFKVAPAGNARAETQIAPGSAQLQVRALPPSRFASDLGAEIGEQLRILLAAGVLVLLIVCANVANLLFARGANRQREMAVRQTLGSGRWRLLRLLLTESLVLAAAGALVGVLIARWSSAALLRFLAPNYARTVLDFSPDIRALTFAASLALFGAVVFGLLPALRTCSVELHATLKAGSAGSGGSRAVLRIGRALVSTQVALSLMLLVTAGVLLRSVRNLNARDPGYERAHVLTFGSYATTLGYEGEREHALYTQLSERLSALPGVHASSYHRYALNRLGAQPCARGDDGLEIRGTFPVGPAFFAALGIPVVAGREFTTADAAGSAAVIVLGESLAREAFPDRNAVGASLRVGGPRGFRTAQVVGVVRDVGFTRPGSETARARCQVYSPVAQAPTRSLGQMTFLLRTAGPPGPHTARLLDAVSQVDRNLAVRDLQTMASLWKNGFRETTALATLTSGFSLLALVFAAIGLFGILLYMVTSRRRELSLRIAIGARQEAVVARMVGEMLRLVLYGTVIGVLASIATVRMTGTFIYGIEPSDPLSIAGAVVVVLLVSLAAAYLPARRASRIDPGLVLRGD